MTGKQVIPDIERSDVGSGDMLVLFIELIKSGACDAYLIQIQSTIRERMHTAEWATNRVIAGGT